VQIMARSADVDQYVNRRAALAPRKRRAAIGTDGYELKFTGSVNAVVAGHDAGEYTAGGAGAGRECPFGIADTKSRVSAPASVHAGTSKETTGEQEGQAKWSNPNWCCCRS
jgi:hypothetical protein